MIPKFSIIIPVYNGEKTIVNALQSISNQNFQNYEIIIVDGKSKDKTLTIIDSFIKNNISIKIKILSEKDLGIYDAMNKGIQLANGHFLYFMGADDEFFSSTVLKELSAVEDVDLIYGSVIGKFSGTTYSSNSLEHILFKGIHHQGIFYNKNVFKQIGKYDLRFRIAADYHLTLKFFLNNNFIAKSLNITISKFGEEGLSSNAFDYKFYSFHYRLLHRKTDLSRFENSLDCLKKSIYCCHYLAQNKQSLFFAWQNLIYYVFRTGGLNLKLRFSTLANMIYWTIKFRSTSIQRKY